MNILIHCIHYPVCSGRYMADAFKRLGHDIKHVGQPAGRNIWGLTLPPEYEWQPDNIDGWTPDLCILMDTAYKWHHPTAPTVVYTVDNHVRDVRQDGIAHYFLAHKKVSVMPMATIYNQPTAMLEDNPYSIADFYPRTWDKTWEVTHLPCAYDPIWFTPSPIPFAERKYDVCMLGVMYPRRRELVDALRAAGLKVIAGTGLVYEAYRDIHHDSRIALCASVAGDVAQRVFEAAAMGCYILTDYCADFDILKPKGLRDYSDTASAVMLAKQVLGKPEFAAEEIARSQAWAATQTWDARAQVIVEWWEANYGTKSVS